MVLHVVAPRRPVRRRERTVGPRAGSPRVRAPHAPVVRRRSAESLDGDLPVLRRRSIHVGPCLDDIRKPGIGGHLHVVGRRDRTVGDQLQVVDVGRRARRAPVPDRRPHLLQACNLAQVKRDLVPLPLARAGVRGRTRIHAPALRFIKEFDLEVLMPRRGFHPRRKAEAPIQVQMLAQFPRSHDEVARRVTPGERFDLPGRVARVGGLRRATLVRRRALPGRA